jgi:hypothetical protein
MNIRNDIRLIDHKIHLWEHNLALSSERLMHQEAFWPIAVVAIILLGLILLSHFAGNTVPPRMYPGPFGPMY